MKFNKLALSVLVALAYASIQVTAVAAVTVPVLGADIKNLTIYGKTYVSTGANSSVLGDVMSGDVMSTGANAKVVGGITSVEASNVGAGTSTIGKSMSSGGVASVGAGANIAGNIQSSGAASIGANAKVGGNAVSGGMFVTGDSATVGGFVKSGEYVSIGANSAVTGNVAGVGATVIGAGGSVGSLSSLSSTPVTSSYKMGLISMSDTDAQQVVNAQNGFSALGFGTALNTTMPTNMTLTGGGVFSVANLSTTASTTLTLDDQNVRHDWVFNITDYLVTGASSKVLMNNMNSGSTLTWNVGNGYVSLGANSNFLGTILAKTYIAVGASTVVAGVNGSCGIYSATSYVSTGDGSIVGAKGCGMATTTTVNPVPEPEGFAMLFAGLISIAFISRRRRAAM